MSNLKNMTEGKPLGLMIRFSLPMLVGNILQLLYSIVDSAVLGRMLGINAFASVLVTASFWWLVISLVFGIMQGFGAYFAQRFGASDMDTLKRSVVTAGFLSVALAVVMGCSLFFACVPLLMLMNTPIELMPGATLYLRVMFVGLPIVFAYNLLGTVLRALGDSKTPLQVMIISTVINIALDFALVIYFGIAGVAVATLIAWVVAGVLCIRVLLKTGVLKGAAFRFDTSCAKALLRLGLPLGLRNAVIEVGGLVVQRYANGYGAEFVAGVGAAKRMYSLLLVVGGAFEAAVATFVGQNTGAGRFDRVKSAVRDGLKLMLVSSVVMAAIAIVFGRAILSLLVSGEPAQLAAVLDVGTSQLRVLALGLPLLYLLFLYRSALQGLGRPFAPMLSGVFELVPRVLCVTLLTPVVGSWAVYLSDPVGWVAAFALLLSAYYVAMRRLNPPYA